MEKIKFPAWHFDTTHKCNINKLKRLISNCEDNIYTVKNSSYNALLMGLEEERIDKIDFTIFVSKLDYYLNNLIVIKGELGYHVVSFNEGYKSVRILRGEFEEVHDHIFKKGYIKRLYMFTHKKYNYIFKGITVDFKNIENTKQARYVSIYIEVLNYTEAINKLWQACKNQLALPEEIFTPDNVTEKLQEICEVTHKILYLYMVYTRSIVKLLKMNTCLQLLNPFDKTTYEKTRGALAYIEYFTS